MVNTFTLPNGGFPPAPNQPPAPQGQQYGAVDFGMPPPQAGGQMPPTPPQAGGQMPPTPPTTPPPQGGRTDHFATYSGAPPVSANFQQQTGVPPVSPYLQDKQEKIMQQQLGMQEKQQDFVLKQMEGGFNQQAKTAQMFGNMTNHVKDMAKGISDMAPDREKTKPRT